MTRDVCPSTRLRCATAARCAAVHCFGHRHAHPISEDDLTRHELYALRLAERPACIIPSEGSVDDLFGALPIPLVAQIREVERELALRERVYPRHVQSGRMTKATAERQVAAMKAVLATLQELHT